MNLLRKLRVYLPALAVALLVGGTASIASADQAAQDAATNTAIEAIFEALGFSPSAAITTFTGKIGGVYLTLLFFGFALSTGWMVYRHYKRAGSKG